MILTNPILTLVLGIASSSPASAAVASACPRDLLSCSSAALKADPCCVPQAGLFLFKQRFEPDVGSKGSWGINNVDILNCDGTQPTTPTNEKLTHEQIGSRCARAGFDPDIAERAWAQSEVGEGVEEVWERVWNTDGRFVSSICDGDVSRFFSALDKLHSSVTTYKWLAKNDITPSADTTYRLADFIAALSKQGHQAVLECDNRTLTAVVYPLHVIGNLDNFYPARQEQLKSNCPAEGIIYPPSAVLPSSARATWDPVYRPSMRPITLSHDEAKQVKYTEAVDQKKKKLKFFKGKDERRAAGPHGHDEYAGRDEL